MTPFLLRDSKIIDILLQKGVYWNDSLTTKTGTIMRLFSTFSKLLFYANRGMAIIEFIVMIFCLNQTIDTGEGFWWREVLLHGFLWIFFWNFATFIKKNISIK